MWCKDVVRFDDLRRKHNLPPNIPSHVINMAESLSRVAVRQIIINSKNRKPNKPAPTKGKRNVNRRPPTRPAKIH